MTSKNGFTDGFGALAGATALCTAFLLLVSGSPAEAKASFTTINVPGATGTMPAAINDGGTVTGVYSDSAYTTHCFIRDAAGTFSYCDPTGSINAFVAGINDKGAVVGTWSDSNAIEHGFVYAANGTITSFDPQGSIRTSANGIDADGDITGEYLDSGNVPHGFICSGKCKTIASFDVPGAAATIGYGINDSQTVVGYYYDGSTQHAFIRTVDGTVTTIDPQNSFYPEAFFINDAGVIAGEYQDQGGYHHGFLRDASGNITSFQVDGHTTFVGGLNSKGDVCGSYELVGSKGLEAWSFIRSSGGKITTYYDPNGEVSTGCSGINATRVTTGLYRHHRRSSDNGYIRTP